MKTVLTFGTFDIVHAGHIHMFKEAKEYGDKLVVAVSRDINVEKIKGEYPMHKEDERCEFLKNLKIIDKVILGSKTNPYKVLEQIRPDIVALGYDQKVYVDKLADAITNFGLSSRIVKLSPYEENRFKSSKIKKYIERIV